MPWTCWQLTRAEVEACSLALPHALPHAPSVNRLLTSHQPAGSKRQLMRKPTEERGDHLDALVATYKNKLFGANSAKASASTLKRWFE